MVEAIDELNHPEFGKLQHQKSYYLQVGAFTSRARAEEQLKKVKLATPEDVPVCILASEKKNRYVI